MKYTKFLFSIILFTIAVLWVIPGCYLQSKDTNKREQESINFDCDAKYFDEILSAPLNRSDTNILSDSCYFELADYVDNLIISFDSDNQYIAALDSLCIYSDGERTELVSAYVMNYFDINTKMLFDNMSYFKSTNCLYPLFISNLIRDLDIESLGEVGHQIIDNYIVDNYNSISTIQELNDSLYYLLNRQTTQ